MDDLTYEIFAYSTDFYQLILQLINFTFFKKVSKIYMILVELVKLFSNQSGLIFGRIYSTKVQIIYMSPWNWFLHFHLLLDPIVCLIEISNNDLKNKLKMGL